MGCRVRRAFRDRGSLPDEPSIRAATGLLVAYLYKRAPGLSSTRCRALVIGAAKHATDPLAGPRPTFGEEDVPLATSAAALFRLLIDPLELTPESPLRQETIVAVVQRAMADLLPDPSPSDSAG
jgi:hypothetical protein